MVHSSQKLVHSPQTSPPLGFVPRGSFCQIHSFFPWRVKIRVPLYTQPSRTLIIRQKYTFSLRLICCLERGCNYGLSGSPLALCVYKCICICYCLWFLFHNAVSSLCVPHTCMLSCQSGTDTHFPGDTQQEAKHGFLRKPPWREAGECIGTLGCHHPTERSVLDRPKLSAHGKGLQGKEPTLYCSTDL